MLSISLSNISKRIKKEFCTSICYSNALKEIMEHQSVESDWLFQWKVFHILFLTVLLAIWTTQTHVCSYMWPESAGMGWFQPVRYSMQTLPIKQHLFWLHSSGNHYPYVHMCLCLCVCFMSGLCRLLGFAAAYLYSVLWNIFQTLWLTWGDPTPHPSAASELYHENTENWHCTCGDVMLTPPLFAIFVITMISLKEMHVSLSILENMDQNVMHMFIRKCNWVVAFQ